MKSIAKYRSAIKKVEKIKNMAIEVNNNFPQYRIPIRPFNTAISRIEKAMKRRNEVN